MATIYKRGGKHKRGSYYYIQWYDHTGKRQTKSARTTDKATAERIASKLEADVALRREGVIDPTRDAISQQAQRTIESHLVDFEAKMRAPNRTEDHVTRTIGYIRRISNYAKFTVASDVSADGVNRYAAMLKNENKAARTIQGHLTAIKSFTKFLAENHKLPRDPLASVKKPNPKADRRRERRMLLPEEWQWLRSTTLVSPERYGMDGTERVLLDETAIRTGLRSGGLRSLTPGRLILDGDKPYIVCQAGSTKNKKIARQYVDVQLASSLRSHVAQNRLRPRFRRLRIADGTPLCDPPRARVFTIDPGLRATEST